MGIDPGSRNVGWGVVVVEGNMFQLAGCGIIKCDPKSVPSKKETAAFSTRLAYIYKELRTVISRYNLHSAAIEQVFTACNAQSALKLGQARGVCVAACAAADLDIYDYEPTLVKKAITGVGRADKEQVAFMVKRLLNVKDAKWALDTSDALAVAICHLAHWRYKTFESKFAD